jgi:hypothetical protein
MVVVVAVVRTPSPWHCLPHWASPRCFALNCLALYEGGHMQHNPDTPALHTCSHLVVWSLMPSPLPRPLVDLQQSTRQDTH